MRVVAALALAVATAGLGCIAASGPAKAVGALPPQISQCYTVMISPPASIRPTITICQP